MNATTLELSEALALDPQGQTIDDAALAMARTKPGQSQDKLRAYLKAHSRTPMISRAIKDVDRWASRATLVYFCFAALSGGLATVSALRGDGAGAVNIFWLLTALLGVHLVMLLFWLFSLAARMFIKTPGFGGFSIASAVRWLTGLAARKLGSAGSKVDAAAQKAALDSISQRASGGATGLWNFSRLSHSFWAIYLLAGFLVSVLMLSMQRFDFVWETTLLDAQAFRSITEVLSGPIAALGFKVPGPGAIDAAQNLNNAGITLAGRDNRSWAQFLLAAILVYGVFVRLVFWAFSALMVRRAEKRRKLDTTAPYNAQILARIYQSQSTGLVVDDDNIGAPLRNTAETVTREIDHLAEQGNVALIGWEMDALPADITRGREVLGWFERPEDLAEVVGTVAGQDLLLAVSLLNTPDRGVSAALTQLPGVAEGQTRHLHILLCHQDAMLERMDEAGAKQRLGDWWSLLLGLGILAENISVLSPVASGLELRTAEISDAD